jgi:trimethylamine--corrinoid protein Co-methyltransferase
VTAVEGIRLNQNLRLKVLTEEQLDTVHEATLRILERTGVRFDHEDARSRLVCAGAAGHPTKKGVVVFPRAVVEEAIRKVPSRNVIHARDPDWDIEYDGEHLFPYAAGGSPKILDLDTGESRHSTYDDVAMAARLGDALENSHYASSLVVANDAPAGTVPLRTMVAAMKNSGKNVAGYAQDGDMVDAMVRLWACVSGGTEELRRRPIFSLGGSPVSPLTYSGMTCEALLRSAEHGIPYTLMPCPICGETGPITLGGSLAQQNAERLAGLVLIQSVTTELPTIYSGWVCMMDPRTGRDLWGTPEAGLASAALVQLARRYRMVADTNGMSPDVTRWDIQMGFESMLTGLMPVLAGAESVAGIGAGWDGAGSLETMVINNEAFNDLARLLEGVRTDEGALALDLIDEVGHMGSFIGRRHTLDGVRRGDVRVSGLWDKRGLDMASREGGRPIHEVARDRVRRLLEEHVPPPLDRDVASAVDGVVREEERARLRRP